MKSIGAMLAAVAVFITGILGMILVVGYQYESSIEQSVVDFVMVSKLEDKIKILPNLDDIPAPVKKYLKKTLPKLDKEISFVRIEKSGQYQLNEYDNKWYSMTATQYVTTKPAGFIWHANVRKYSMINVGLLDKYWQGIGTMDNRMLGTFIIAKESNTNDINEAVLQRYLAESVWYPTILLPSEQLKWFPVNKETAIAELSEGGYKVKVTFQFNEDDEVSQATAERYRYTDGIYQKLKWSLYFSDYQIRDGIRIPLQIDVEWHLIDGNWVYRKERIDTIEYNNIAPYDR